MDTKWIDYRAWHIEKKVMMHVSEIDFRKRRIKGRAKDEVISARFDEVTLMPWTTYYDSSHDDMMIYEGDIVEVTHKDMNDEAVCHRRRNGRTASAMHRKRTISFR